MHPYDENSEDPKYQKFEDHTDRLKHEYENEKVNCIKMPDGRIFEEDHHVVRNKYVIRDGMYRWHRYNAMIRLWYNDTSVIRCPVIMKTGRPCVYGAGSRRQREGKENLSKEDVFYE